MNLDQQVKEKLVTLNSLLREFRGAFKLPQEEKEAKKLEILGKIFELSPKIAETETKEDLAKRPSDYIATKIATILYQEVVENYGIVASEEIDLSALDNLFDGAIEETEVFVPTGKKEKVFITSDGQETEDFVEIPQFESRKVKVLNEENISTVSDTLKNALTKSINTITSDIRSEVSSRTSEISSRLDSLPSNSEAGNSELSEYQVAKFLQKVLDGSGEVTLSSADGQDTARVNFGHFIDRYNLTTHYYELGQSLLDTFKMQNGIRKKVEEIEVDRRLPDGSTQKVKEPREMLYADYENASPFTTTLFQTTVQNPDGTTRNLYREWSEKFLTKLSKNLYSWVQNSKASKISEENDSKFYHFFWQTQDEVVKEMASNYSTNFGWETNVFKNPFEDNDANFAGKMANTIKSFVNDDSQVARLSPQFQEYVQASQAQSNLPMGNYQSNSQQASQQLQRPQESPNHQSQQNPNAEAIDEDLSLLTGYMQATMPK